MTAFAALAPASLARAPSTWIALPRLALSWIALTRITLTRITLAGLAFSWIVLTRLPLAYAGRTRLVSHCVFLSTAEVWR